MCDLLNTCLTSLGFIQEEFLQSYYLIRIIIRVIISLGLIYPSRISLGLSHQTVEKYRHNLLISLNQGVLCTSNMQLGQGY